MREQQEMYTVSRMRDMVQIRQKNNYFMTNLLLYFFGENRFGGLSALKKAPAVGPFPGAVKLRPVSARFSDNMKGPTSDAKFSGLRC